MYEHAPVSVWAEVFFMELLALFGLVFSTQRLFFVDQIFSSMGELTFSSIPTKPLLNPIFAHFSFILSFIHFW
jgi:hypothetical protein